MHSFLLFPPPPHTRFAHTKKKYIVAYIANCNLYSTMCEISDHIKLQFQENRKKSQRFS